MTRLSDPLWLLLITGGLIFAVNGWLEQSTASRIRLAPETRAAIIGNQRALVVAAGPLVASPGLASRLAFRSPDTLGVSGAVRWPLLLGFNLGVEVGQLLFVGLILIVLQLSQRPGQAPPARQALTWSSGNLGPFWLFESLLSLG